MTPLSDDEKQTITRTYSALKLAIDGDAADVAEKYDAFRNAYRGESRAYVDSLDQVTDRLQWLGQLRMYLSDEIEGEFWIGST